jgi:hypothetical protein
VLTKAIYSILANGRQLFFAAQYADSPQATSEARRIEPSRQERLALAPLPLFTARSRVGIDLAG